MKHSVEDAQRILSKGEILKVGQPPQPGSRCVRLNYYGLKDNPADIRMDTPAGVVFYNLQLCYKTSKNICEASIEDVIWGFRQSGIPNDITWQGFRALAKAGYINFTNDKNIVLLGGITEKSWYSWTDKYYKLLLSGPEKTVEVKIDDTIKGKDTTYEKIDG